MLFRRKVFPPPNVIWQPPISCRFQVIDLRWGVSEEASSTSRL